MLNTGFLPGGLPRRTPFLKKCTRLRGVFSKKGSELHFTKSGCDESTVFFDSLFFWPDEFCLFSLMPFLAIGHPLKIEFLCSSGALFTKAFLSKFFAYF